MTTKQILEKIQDKKGASLNVRITSEVPTLKAYNGHLIQKISELTIVSGISFENRTDIKTAIEQGERGEVQPLKWGAWTKFPFVIGHKGADYIRLYLPSKAQQEIGFKRETSVKFLLNGREITRDEAITYCGSKAETRENEQGVMTVKAENLAFI